MGDEPALIQRRTGAPVFVAEQRVQAAQALLARHPQTQLILSDDGLQHQQLHRDLEIGVFDECGVGNGFLLPAGPLRSEHIEGLPWLALAAIARPEAFFSMLRDKGLNPARTLALPDHYDFKSFLPSEYEGYRLICTEKDAVKLWPQCPDALAVPLIPVFPDEFWRAFDAHVDTLLALPERA